MAYQKIGIVGGGAWGTALAQAVIKSGRDALLWAFEAATTHLLTWNVYKMNFQKELG